jgi:hypothetical protein
MMSASRTQANTFEQRGECRANAQARARGPSITSSGAFKIGGGKARRGFAPVVPVQVLYRLCKPGWAVTVEKTPNAQGTRFVCPFCPVSHRVPGPVRGFRKLRRAQWVKLRRVEE